MRRFVSFFLLTGLVLLLVSCRAGETAGSQPTDKTMVFSAVVLEGGSQPLLVEPHKDAAEYRSADKITVHAENATVIDANGNDMALADLVPGQTLEITYNGLIRESYPAQIDASAIKVVG